MNQISFPNNDKIISFIKRHNLINPENLNKLESEVKHQQISLGQRLFDIGILKEDDFAWLSSQLLSLPLLEISQINLDPDLTGSLPIDLLLKYNFIPIENIQGDIIIGVVNPFEEGLDDILHLIYSENYRLNIIKENDFEKLVKKLDYTLPAEAFPSIGFSDNLLNEIDLSNDDSCIGLSYYLILSLFKARNRYISLFPYLGSAEIRIIEGKKEIKNLIIEKHQFFILLWRLKKIFGINSIKKNSIAVENIKDFFHEKQHYILNFSLFGSLHGEGGIISHLNTGIVIEESPIVQIDNFEMFSGLITSSDSGVCIGFNNLFSKLILLERIAEICSDHCNPIYITSNKSRIPEIEIPVVIIEKSIKNFGYLSNELLKIYSHIIIDDYDFSCYASEQYSFKKMIILVSSIDYFTPVNYLLSVAEEDVWKLNGIGAAGIVFDTSDGTGKPLLIGDFYKLNPGLLIQKKTGLVIKKIENNRERAISSFLKNIILTENEMKRLNFLLGVNVNDN
ncbi:MAG: hypothetical protein PHV06_02770 [bacterium]|nr:hypothetical protein [bacterium]